MGTSLGNMLKGGSRTQGTAGMKSGCNFVDRNQIRQLVAQAAETGEPIDLELTSRILQVQLHAVENWVNHYIKELAPAQTAEESDEYVDVAPEEDEEEI